MTSPAKRPIPAPASPLPKVDPHEAAQRPGRPSKMDLAARRALATRVDADEHGDSLFLRVRDDDTCALWTEDGKGREGIIIEMDFQCVDDLIAAYQDARRELREKG